MKKQYSYLNDKEFLGKLDISQVQEYWVKITLLSYNSEKPIESIEGQIVSGSLSKNGDSNVRRTCSLSCTVNPFEYKVEDIKSNYSISKKIYLELGVTNNTDEYTNEKIIWFPQGVFFITSFAISSSASGETNINLEFKDKMAKLDGTIGGVLPSTVRFDTVTTVVNGTAITSKALVYDIIMETVNHFGGEDLSNIIIDDIPRKAKRIIRWMGTEPLWIYPISNNGKISYDVCFGSDLNEKQGAHHPIFYNNQYIAAKEYQTNQDIGYMYEDFVYDQELTFNAGSKVTDVLDKIKSWLGNYEYFYDEYGQFHFQEIKNYLNNSQSAFIWEKIQETSDIDYLYESTHGKSVYTFEDEVNLISITNTPVYENIKNDFIVEGTVTSDNNIKHVCRYHLVIDDKPTITSDGHNNVLIYVDPLTNNTCLGTPEIITPVKINNKWVWTLPEFAEEGKIYGLLEEPQTCNFKKQLKSTEEFATEYNKFVDQENLCIDNDNNYFKETLPENIQNNLLALLERYMNYVDNTTYKETYRDIIFTLARQLQRYNISIPQDYSPLSGTIDYYNTLYQNFINGIPTYLTELSWCGELLKLLHDIFNIGDDPSDPNNDPDVSIFIDSTYWPAINIDIPELWDGIETQDHTTAYIQVQRKNQCRKYINKIRIKQTQLDILIKQYIQIINNHNTQISLSAVDNIGLIQERNILQKQVDNWQEELEYCNKRLTILYAALTMFEIPDSIGGRIYYDIDIKIPVYKTSFWYFNTNKKMNNYGWNELVWFKYYHEWTSYRAYYPNGLGSMTYIDYSNINWEEIDYLNNKPSMNRYSDWYLNSYIDYAKNHDLEYIDSNENTDAYIPNNWRTELLLLGLEAEKNGTDPGYYYNELKANLPVVYNFKTGELIASSIDFTNYFNSYNAVITTDNFSFLDGGDNANMNAAHAEFKTNEVVQIQDSTANYENDYYYYFFDMIDSSSPIWGEYSVNNIGRRTNVNVKESVNCIFAPEIPNYAFLNISGKTTKQRQKAYEELSDIAEDIIQITDFYYDNFATGGIKQSAYEQIKYDLQQYTTYQNTVSITAIPCFYLESNTRVTLNDHTTNTYGDYIVKSISISFGGNTMSVSLSKAMEKL